MSGRLLDEAKAPDPGCLAVTEAVYSLGWAEALRQEALARLRPAQQQSQDQGCDRNLSAKEAARRIGVSLPYLYKHARECPFTIRVGRRVVFLASGLEAWLRSKGGSR